MAERDVMAASRRLTLRLQRPYDPTPLQTRCHLLSQRNRRSRSQLFPVAHTSTSLRKTLMPSSEFKSVQAHWLVVVLSLVAGVVLLPAIAPAADQARIDEAIKRGRSFLTSQPKAGAEGALACYALVKSGTEKTHPHVLKGIEEVVAKCQSDVYRPGHHFNYEAGVDAMLLEAVDPVAYQPQLQKIANFLVAQQRPCGAWFYNNELNQPNYGDTSISQYAILGLWAASRAGVEVPIETWEQAAQWAIRTQCSDGGFAYHPYEGQNQMPEFQVSTVTMAAAGTGILLIIRRELFTDIQFDDATRPAVASKRFGVLERFQEEKQVATPKVKTNPTLPVSSIDKALKESVKWMGNHLADKTKQYLSRPCYYFYSVERVAALLDVEKIGVHDWYQEGVDDLLLRQRPEGSWNDENLTVGTTSLAILFLTKATSTILPKARKAPLVGGGLLVGGRGLPDKLDAVQIKEGQAAARKLQGPVDGLLAELEKSGDAKVEAVQAAVVEAVQLDRPEELIAQVDRLKKLAIDSRVEVRRTAMWALGRTGNITVAPLLIAGLRDTDESVAREASVGLTILSRRPEGCGLPLEPTDGLLEDASAEARKTHLDQWRKESSDLWQKWYLRVRPYEERDDRTVLKRKQ